MQTPRAYWPAWVEHLQNLKLDSFVAWLLDAGAPFTLLVAQMLYFVRPFHSVGQVEALASMLEQGDETRAFIGFLRGEKLV
ncbi:MAG: hypothetical protein ACOYYU_03500 [Chloroflexota bacterium]